MPAKAVAPGRRGRQHGHRPYVPVDSDDRRADAAGSSRIRQLTTEQKAVLKRWVARRGRVPAALGVHRRPPGRRRPGREECQVGADADRHVPPGRTWRSESLTPAPEADRRTLARRLALDLTGLPPELGRRRGVRGRHVGRTTTRSTSISMMASPRWGEHRGRYWLDAARYADTHGIHFDNYRENWAYRDWVVNGPSTRTSGSTSSPANNSPATSCRTRAWTSSWSPRVSIGVTLRLTRAGRSARSTWFSIPGTGRKPRRRCGSA